MAEPASTIAFDAPPCDGTRTLSQARPIDLDHLARQTRGDKSLEIEVLQLFARQARQVVRELAESDPAKFPFLAHQLKGAALAVGAQEVVEATRALEAGPVSAETLATLHARVLDCELFILKLCR